MSVDQKELHPFWILNAGCSMIKRMAEQWIIQVQGKDYGPVDLATLHEWKADGRVLPTNAARRADVDAWQTAAEIPGLFKTEPPPVQVPTRDQRAGVTDRRVESKPPTRNILTETFRIYFRGFFQFFGLSLLSIVPIACAELTSRFIDTSGVNADLRSLVAGAFGLCMIVLRLVLLPVYIAGIQILTAELATGNRISFLSVLNGAVKYWPRVAGLCIFVYVVFSLLIVFGFGLLLMAGTANTVLSAVIVLGLLAIQVWLFSRFFINVLFWQQFAVLENLNAAAALRESRKLARGARDLPWYQRPLWRGALIVSVWFVFVLAITITPQWQMLQNYLLEVARTQDPQALYEKMLAAMQTHGVDYQALALNVLERILQPLLGIAFVVLYLDSKREDES
jgi:GYF domain 2